MPTFFQKGRTLFRKDADLYQKQLYKSSPTKSPIRGFPDETRKPEWHDGAYNYLLSPCSLSSVDSVYIDMIS